MAAKLVDTPIGVLIEQADKVDETQAEVAAFLARWGDRYSRRNLLLLYIQRPDATELHTYKGWLREGRQVRRGEKAVRLFVPKGKDDPEGFSSEEKIRVRPISLFDVAQTDPIPADDEKAGAA